MSYTPEIFNRFNTRVQESRNAVCRHIQYLLKPNHWYPKGSDEKLKELYNIWRADCRAMDAACQGHDHLSANHEMIEMPPDDEEHFLCRRMAAVIIERCIFGEFNAQEYLPELLKQIKESNCHTHASTCACHNVNGWTYYNQDLINTLSAHYLEAARRVNPASLAGGERVACGGWRDCTCGGCFGGGGAPPPLRRSDQHVVNCACGSCYNKRVAEGTQDAYLASLRAETDKILAKSLYTGTFSPEDSSIGGARSPIEGILAAARHADDAIAEAKKMPGGSTDDGFVKNLFKTVQGVEFDSKCPHGLPFYACMPCSH